MAENIWLIPLFPLLAFVVLVIFHRQMKHAAAYIGILAVIASFVLSLLTFLEQWNGNGDSMVMEFDWLTAGNAVFSLGAEITHLNAMMLLIVSLVSLLVHIYAKGYMADDKRISVFYMYLALFTFSMLGLVISPNFLQLFIFWELVGVCSFLLVGFYFSKPEARDAAKKAFIVTRIGDIGLFIAIILTFLWAGSLNYTDVFNAVETGTFAGWQLTLVCILIFVGAMGKSGQFPLHTWLPDAMEGPTPVSALIHAATMVAAGVYLVARTFEMFVAAPVALDVVAYVGAFTAIFAASIGLTQTDIKRVLAYSTVSQLGYMMLALGAAGLIGYVGGTFHLMTHAFFKALLFLAAGSVIHAVHTQNIFEMGGLWKRMRVTGTVFLIGCLAIAGIPPFAGYFSKEEILMAAFEAGRADLFWIAVAAAFFTAFYMFRLFFLTFTAAKEGREVSASGKESPPVMTGPMLLLAALSVVAGWLHTPWNPLLGDWLTQELTVHGEAHAAAGGWIPYLTVGISLAGILLAWLMYHKQALRRDVLSDPLPWLYQLSYRKYYIDEIYRLLIVTPLRLIGRVLSGLDRYIVDGIVTVIAAVPALLGKTGAKIQNGQVQTYGAVTVLGLLLLLIGLTVYGGYLG